MYKPIFMLALTAFVFSFMVLVSELDYIRRPTASIVLFLGVFFSLRPKKYVHPCMLVLVNYLLYFVMPYSLYLIYDMFDIDYILPWGMLYDWGKVSATAVSHFELTFLFFYLGMFFSSEILLRKAVSNTGAKREYDVRLSGVMILMVTMAIGIAAFLNRTGGLSAWISNYSSTYITAKEGIGFINYLLINTAHLLAFIAGWIIWRTRKKVSYLIWLPLIAILILCIFLQGIKSRIPLILFFFLMPKISTMKVNIRKAVIIFFSLILFFMVAMYFRSDGFYSTPRMAIEYLQSYFNMIFLHDMVLTNYFPGEWVSMFMGMNKYTEIFVGKLPRETYDLSVALTQIYYPDTWFKFGATQQWPIESDFYLTFPSPLFWALPICLYSLMISVLYKFATNGVPVIMFIYSAEFVRIMSIFRSSLLTWNVLIIAIFYVVVLVGCTALIFRKERIVAT